MSDNPLSSTETSVLEAVQWSQEKGPVTVRAVQVNMISANGMPSSRWLQQQLDSLEAKGYVKKVGDCYGVVQK